MNQDRSDEEADASQTLLARDASAGEMQARALGARLDRLAIGSFHHRLALIVAAGLIVDGVDIAISASIGGALLSTGFTDIEGVGALAMSTALGLGLGGLVMGFLADRFGRMMMMRINIVIVAVAGLAAALAPTLEVLLVWRALTALALGGETVLAYGILTEFMPARRRGLALAWVALLATIGLPLSMALAYFIAPLEHGWRWLLAAPSLAALVVFGLRLALPESPLWLASRGRIRAAEHIVARLEARSPSFAEMSPAAGAQTAIKAAAPLASQSATRKGGVASRLLVAGGIHIAAMTAVFGFVSWLPTFFVASGRDVAASALFGAVMTAGAPVGGAIALGLADVFERKWMLVVGAVGACALGLLYVMADTDAGLMSLGFLTVSAIYFTGIIGMVTYVPELFSTAVRLRALGFVSALGRGAALAAPMIVPALFGAFGQGGVVALVCVVLFIQALLVAWLGPLTNNRSLTQI